MKEMKRSVSSWCGWCASGSRRRR